MSEAAPPVDPDDVPPADAPPAVDPPADDTAAFLAALRAEVDSVKADKAAATAAAEESRKASMSEAERVAEERKALDSERKAMLTQARDDAAAKLGIYPKALVWVPGVDPRTADGAKALADWAKENPEFVKPATVPEPVVTAPAGSRLAKILSGEIVDPFLTPEGARAMLTGGGRPS